MIEQIGGKKAILGVRRTNGPSRGTVLAIGGHAGQQWQERMVAAGYDLEQMKYLGLGWPNPIEGNKHGFLRLACRPATIIKWVHDNSAPRREIHGHRFVGGQRWLGYSTAMYGSSVIVDRAVYISGPPMMELVTACLANR